MGCILRCPLFLTHVSLRQIFFSTSGSSRRRFSSSRSSQRLYVVALTVVAATAKVRSDVESVIKTLPTAIYGLVVEQRPIYATMVACIGQDV